MNLGKPMDYFRILTDDVNYPDRWFLEDPLVADMVRPNAALLAGEGVERSQSVKNGDKVDVWLVPMDNLSYSLTVFPSGECEIDAREFTEGRRYSGPSPYRIPFQDGRRVAFNLGSLDMPVVTTEIADILQELAPGDIERFPVTIGSNIAGYEIINAIHHRRCVNEEYSGVTKWTLDDHRADLAGQYRSIDHLVIDPSRTGGSHIFRLWGSLIELIVAEDIKLAIEPIQNLGVVFDPVT